MLEVTLTYASEKFSLAVGAMALSTETLQERLAKAWIHNITFIITNDVSKLPADIQARLSELSKDLHAAERTGAGPDINSLVYALDEGQVRDAIDEIVSLCFAIDRALALGGPGS